MTTATSETHPRQPDPLALGLSLTHVLGHPLAALRASIESLADGLDREDPRGRVLAGALEQVTRLARDVQSLVEYAAPRPLAPLRCSLDEIVLAVRRALGPEREARLQLARPAQGASIHVDGTALTGCLASLAQVALESAPDGVLLQVRRDATHTHFVFVQGHARAEQADFEPAALVLDGPAHHAALAVRLAVARRDLQRMGGRLQVQHTARGFTCVSVVLPDLAPRTGGVA